MEDDKSHVYSGHISPPIYTHPPSKADCMNEEGNTPLHYACQHCVPGKTFTINKLLQQDCGVLVPNKAGDSPFDLAVRFNKRGIHQTVAHCVESHW